MRKVPLRVLRAAAGVAALLVAAPLASATTPDSSTGRRADQHTEIVQLDAKQVRSDKVDLGKKGISPGDGIVIAEDLHRGGKKIGDHSVVCTYIRVTPGELQCVGTFSLPEGQVTSQALLQLPATSSVDIAITGGTGDYRSARGFVHTVPAGTTERRLTFHIIVDDQPGD